MPKQFWLMKSEPTSYSIDDLKKDKSTLWEGVRNYQARNLMKEIKVGDDVLFYHSSVEPPAAVGLAEVSGLAEPDPTQFDTGDSHYDPKALPADPIWQCVRVKFKEKFARIDILNRHRKKFIQSESLMAHSGIINGEKC